VRDLADPAACVSSCTAIIECDGMIVTETELVSGFGNINSTGGTMPQNLPGAIQPVGSTADNTNASAIGSQNRTIVIEFDDVLPAGTPVTISMAINNEVPFLGQLASATITDFTNSQTFTGGNIDEIQHITFVTGQATNIITIDSDNSTLNLVGAVWVDGASYTDVPIVTETFVCNECPPCPVACTITTSQDATCIGASDGSLTATGTGSVSGNYEFSLDAFATAGQTSGTFTDLAAGTYVVSVRDPNDTSCQSNCTATLGELPVECPQCPPVNCINQFGEFIVIKRLP